MRRDRERSTYKLTLTAILAAQALVLAYVEMLIPLAGMPPGIKLGLSNIIVMYTLSTVGSVSSFFIVLVKAIFVFITRGGMSTILSFAGGITSVLVMILLSRFKKLGYASISIAGAVTHNLAQLLIVSLVTYINTFLVYAPVMIISGIIMGIITGVVLKIIIPLLNKQGLVFEKL